MDIESLFIRLDGLALLDFIAIRCKVIGFFSGLIKNLMFWDGFLKIFFIVMKE